MKSINDEDRMKKISICIPCYNEEKNIENMYGALKQITLKLKQYKFEMIFSDNASVDNSVDILKKIASQDKNVKVVINSRNFGPNRSGTNCLFHATGDAVIFIPCDFQDPPEMIIDFINYWEKGSLVVWGEKTRSRENPIMYKVRTVYYNILKSFSSTPVYKHVDGFGLYDKSVIETAKQYIGVYDGMKGFVAEAGYAVALVPYTQNKRKEGKSSYSLKRYCDAAIEMICHTSTIPLRISFYLGIIIGSISFIIGLVYLIYKLLFWESFSVGVMPIVIGVF